jgi:hypothetical protein
MSGFLRRLAAQALGNANTLRSAARLPYATSLSPSPEAHEYAAEQDWQGGAEPRHSASAVRMANHMPEHAHRHANSSTEIGAQNDGNEAAPSSPEIEILVGQPAPEFAKKSDHSCATSPSLRAERIDTGGQAIAVDEPISIGGIETPIPANNFATTPTGHNKHNSAFSESPMDFLETNSPAPLLPPRNVPHSPAFNTGMAAQRGGAGEHAWQGQVEETTEVHVSIGRIEVTAVHEAPPPKRQAPAAAKPMSLDEYLARRKREA